MGFSRSTAPGSRSLLAIRYFKRSGGNESCEGKAMLVRDIFYDGMGACLDVYPTGALTVIEKDAASYDEKTSVAHVTATRGSSVAEAVHRETAAPYFNERDLPGHPCRGLWSPLVS
jgi:hypothetical protein